MNDLIPCPGCSRHVRRSETSCPFCSASVRDAALGAPVRQLPAARLGRLALFTFAAASIGTAACGGDEGEKGPGTGGAGGAANGSGGASTGGTQNAAGKPAAGGYNQGGSAMALYGAAPHYGLPAPDK